MLNKNKERGIILIALVITIIVLLILARVSIARLTGEGRLVKQVENAKEKAEMEEAEERIILAITDWIRNKNATSENIQDFMKLKVDEVIENGDDYYLVKDGYQILVDKDGNIKGNIEKAVVLKNI